MRYGGWVENLVLRSSSGWVFSLSPEQLYKAVDYGDIKLVNMEIVSKDGKYEFCDIEPCNLTREKTNDDSLFVWNFLEAIKRAPQSSKEEAVNFIKTTGYGIDEEDLISIITESDEWYPARFWSSDTMFRDRAFDVLEKFGFIKIDEDKVKERLADDIIKQAKTDAVYVMDYESGVEQGYELNTLDDYLSHCNLPDSVVKYVKENDKSHEFITELFDLALERNVVPAFQYAEGIDYCNYTSAYRTMTADYEYAKKTLTGDIEELACGTEKTTSDYISETEVKVYGNSLGKEWFDKIIAEIK